MYVSAYVWHKNTDGQGSVGVLTLSTVRQHCYSGNKGWCVWAFRTLCVLERGGGDLEKGKLS